MCLLYNTHYLTTGTGLLASHDLGGWDFAHNVIFPTLPSLLNFLKTLEFVESVASTDMPTEKGRGEEADFFALAGLWAGRDVSLQSIREKAWPYRV